VSRAVRPVLVAVVAVLALAGGYLAHMWLTTPEPPTADPASVLLGTTLEDMRGEPQPISRWRGQILVVNFWATWCPPCVKEIPELIRVQQRLGPEGVQVIGIAIDDRTRVLGFAAQFGINYPVLIAAKEGITLARDAGNRLGALPFTVIIDREGRTAKVELGVLDEAKLTAIVRQIR